MISVTWKRLALVVVAATTNDYGDIALGWGFTQRGALERLDKALLELAREKVVIPAEQVDEELLFSDRDFFGGRS